MLQELGPQSAWTIGENVGPGWQGSGSSRKEPERVKATCIEEATQLQAKEAGPLLTWLLCCQGPGGKYREHLQANERPSPQGSQGMGTSPSCHLGPLVTTESGQESPSD